jgi:DegV family protein with EDD domain
MRVGLVTDSVADIPLSLCQQYDIQVIPSIVVINGQEYLDGIDITRDAFYMRMAAPNTRVTTAAPGPGSFAKCFKTLFSAGFDHILCIHTAANLSGIYNAACLAAQPYSEKVTILDSGQLSLGVGFQVLAAARGLAAGKSLDDVVSAVQHTRVRLKVVALMNTLENLRRSGRVNFLTAGLGNLLDIKLFVSIKDGDVLRLGSTRTWSKALTRMVEQIRLLGPLEQLGVMHANNEADARRIFAELEITPEIEPLFINITPSIGVHVGPSAVGFAALQVAQG